MALLKRIEKHNKIDIDAILNNQKQRKRNSIYPKELSDEEEDIPEIDIRNKKEDIKIIYKILVLLLIWFIN